MRSFLKAVIPAPVRRWLRAGGGAGRLQSELVATQSLLERVETDLRAYAQAEAAASRAQAENTRFELMAFHREIEDQLRAVRGALEELPDRQDRLEESADDTRSSVSALKEMIDRLGHLAGRADDTTSRLAALENTIDRLTARARQQRQIDVVAYGETKLFMHTDDLGYQCIPPGTRNQRCTPVDLSDVPVGADNLTAVLLSHYWDNGLDPWVLDVGANYGHEAIYTARLMRSAGRDGRVVAFEPGVSGALLPHSIALNRIADRVWVEPVAIGNYTGPGLMFGEDSQSQNNRIVNRCDGGDWAAFSRIIPVDTLDAYTNRKGITADLIVKIDTQGAEPETTVFKLWCGPRNRNTDRGGVENGARTAEFGDYVRATAEIAQPGGSGVTGGRTPSDAPGAGELLARHRPGVRRGGPTAGRIGQLVSPVRTPARTDDPPGIRTSTPVRSATTSACRPI